MIYIACPYWHDEPDIRSARVKLATRYAARLAELGEFAFSPLTHSHYIALECSGVSESHWLAMDMVFMPACDSMHILCAPGWEYSNGIKAEINKADEIGISYKLIECGLDDFKKE